MPKWLLIVSLVIAVFSIWQGNLHTDKLRKFYSLAAKAAGHREASRSINESFANWVVTAVESEMESLNLLPAVEFRRKVMEVFNAEISKTDSSFSHLNLTDRRHFDAYSYAQFVVLASLIHDKDARLKFLESVGRRILQFFDNTTNLTEKTEGLDEMEEPWEEPLLRLLSELQRVGYVEEAGVNWVHWNHDKWRSEGKSRFQYWMKDPVILPSAQRLFVEYGFAQHFSSRTIGAFFLRIGIDAAEDPHFDPNEHPVDMVVEDWYLRKLQPIDLLSFAGAGLPAGQSESESDSQPAPPMMLGPS